MRDRRILLLILAVLVLVLGGIVFSILVQKSPLEEKFKTYYTTPPPVGVRRIVVVGKVDDLEVMGPVIRKNSDGLVLLVGGEEGRVSVKLAPGEQVLRYDGRAEQLTRWERFEQGQIAKLIIKAVDGKYPNYEVLGSSK